MWWAVQIIPKSQNSSEKEMKVRECDVGLSYISSDSLESLGSFQTCVLDVASDVECGGTGLTGSLSKLKQ